MLPVERREHVLAYVEEKGCANIEEMATRFSVSHMTIRRDIRLLERDNKLKVTHGGAISRSFLMEDISYEKKNAVNTEEKKSIAVEAVKRVKEGQTILLDAGTSTLCLARLLVRMRVTVVTPDLEIALHLADSLTATVFLTGGRVNSVTRSHYDSSTLSFIESVNADIAFLATNSWSIAEGVTTASTENYFLRRKMMEHSQQSVLLADSSKFGAAGMRTVCQLKELDLIVTDHHLQGESLALIEESGVDVVCGGC